MEKVNPKYVEESRKRSGPLFDSLDAKPLPPETITPSQTRRESHQRLKNNEYPLELVQLRVFNCIKKFGPIGSREIAERTKIERHVVTARIVELRHDLDLIDVLTDELDGSVKKMLDTKTNRNVTHYIANGKSFTGRSS